MSQGANLNIIPAKGFGGTHPEASNDTPQGWASALQRYQGNSIVVSGGLPHYGRRTHAPGPEGQPHGGAHRPMKGLNLPEWAR
ncbi:MAG: hypothetical protein J2P48_08590 [Alphaproteobacteria bacterium]|nr:hypothetical protein [Alphaproteobacteria bacterium]